MKEFENIVSTAYWIVLALLAVIFIARLIYYLKTRSSRIKLDKERTPFQYIRYLVLLSLPMFVLGLVKYLFVLQKGNMFASQGMKTALIAMLGLVTFSELIYNYWVRPKKVNRFFNALLLAMTLGLGMLFHWTFYQANQYPSVEKSVVVDLPFKGSWVTTGGGATGLTNHHDRIPSQKYAIDIAKLGGDGKLFMGEGMTKEESYTFGAKIYSPVNGKVVHLVNDMPDVKVKERDKLAGNHLIIQFQDSLYVALAHLKNQSIKVGLGDRVVVGQDLAEVGLSGNTDFAHLHIHIQDTPTYDIENTRTYPIRFREFERQRYLSSSKVENAYVLSNDIVSSIE